jgi:hypothetical protein
VKVVPEELDAAKFPLARRVVSSPLATLRFVPARSVVEPVPSSVISLPMRCAVVPGARRTMPLSVTLKDSCVSSQDARGLVREFEKRRDLGQLAVPADDRGHTFVNSTARRAGKGQLRDWLSAGDGPTGP